jgi:hypothetical protein
MNKYFTSITGEQVEAQPWQRALMPGDCYLLDYSNPATTIYCQVLSRAAEVGEGFLWVMAYSERLPGGERGVNCIVDGTRPITPQEFEQARERGWQ